MHTSTQHIQSAHGACSTFTTLWDFYFPLAFDTFWVPECAVFKVFFMGQKVMFMVQEHFFCHAKLDKFILDHSLTLCDRWYLP